MKSLRLLLICLSLMSSLFAVACDDTTNPPNPPDGSTDGEPDDGGDGGDAS